VSEPERSLKSSAQSGLLWGVTFTFGRDALQFVTMLVLVRLLAPTAYGQATLAQTILGVVSMASLKTLGPYALQARDPDQFDWDLHYTAGAIVSLFAFFAALAVAAILWLAGGQIQAVAPLLAVLSTTFLIEIPGSHYLMWLQARHDWRRLRLQMLLGAVISSVAAIGLALMGAGVYALVAPGPLLVAPLTIDFFFFAKLRRRWKFAPRQYADGWRFTANRIASGLIGQARTLFEQGLIASLFSYATLGVYGRASGLATLACGRFGPIVVQTLYPILTRAEPQSARFQGFAAALLQGIAWISLPAAAFLGLHAAPIVQFLYGARWSGVAPLLPVAGVFILIGGIATTVSQLLLGNEQRRATLTMDAVTALTAIPVAFIAIPRGVLTYLVAATVQVGLMLAVSLVLLARGGGIGLKGVVDAFAPPILACAVASAMELVLERAGLTGLVVWVQLMLEGVVFGVGYVAALRILFPRQLATLLDIAPGGAYARRALAMSRSGLLGG
jgi:PST family polysaccharide transporter